MNFLVLSRYLAPTMPDRIHLTTSFLLLALLITISPSAAASATLNLLPTLNASHEYNCNNLPSWANGRPYSPTYKPQDCTQAMRTFDQDAARNPGKTQWLSLQFPQAVPGYGAPVWTPRRYTSGEILNPSDDLLASIVGCKVCKFDKEGVQGRACSRSRAWWMWATYPPSLTSRAEAAQ